MTAKKIAWRTFLVLLAASITGWIALKIKALPDWFWHPLTGLGYQFWSGIGSDIGEISTPVSIAAGILFAWRHLNCHADRCYRIGWHLHGDHGHPVCKHHHPQGDNAPHTIGGEIRS